MNLISDPIVEEVRKARNEHAAKFGHNIDDIVKDIQNRQKRYGVKLVRRCTEIKIACHRNISQTSIPRSKRTITFLIEHVPL